MVNHKQILRDYIKHNMLKTKLGEIKDLKEIGEGGNGIVFTGKIYDKEIAVKILYDSSSRKLGRFKAEFLYLNFIPAKDYVVKTLFYDEVRINDVNFPMIVMKKYQTNLKKFRNEPISYAQLKILFEFLINSVGFIHQHGIIHRDLKPENILTDDENFVLSDFGIASYNLKMFKQLVKTGKGERVGNFSFSAPEQAIPGAKPKETMDIYAIGQLCQWYVTGNVHKGTRREPLTKYIKECDLLDVVVDKCLANDPRERFQSISEIKTCIQQWTSIHLENRPDPFDLLHLFHEAISATFPKKRRGAISTNDPDLIDRLFKSIMERDFRKKLWWMRAFGDNTVQFRKLNSNHYLMSEFEISIKEIWAYSDESVYADAILLILNSMSSFGVYDDISDLDMDTVGLVDGKTYITGEEYDHGYAELDGQIVNLSEHDVELRSRFLKPTAVFIIPIHSPLMQRESEQIARQLLKRFENENGEKPSLEEFEKLIMETRSNMPDYIREWL